nr:RhoGAP domain-containing protein [Colletotrichum truncatum]KAF6796674.1 RhoGAP domain-containing protein [Colletotrichum truncatum]
MEERNEHGEGSLCQIWASEETPSPLSSRVSLEPHEQPLALRSRTTIEESVDNHYAEPKESLREPQLPRPETSSSSSTSAPSISGSTEPLPFMSESVPQAIESLKQTPDQSVVPKGDSDPHDAPTSTVTTASTVFGTTLEESMCHAGVKVGVIDRWLSSHGAPTTMQGHVPIVVSQCFKFLQAKETRGLSVQLPSLRRRNVEKRLNKLRRAFEIAAKDGTELTPDLLHRGGFNDQDMKDILLSYLSSLPERLVHWEVNSDQFSFYLRLITKSRRGKLGNAESLEIMNFLGRKTCSLPITNHFILLYLLNELEMCHNARRVSRDYIQDLGQAVFSIPLESSDIGDDVAG